MKNLRKAAALALSLILTAGLSSCESDPVASGVELVDDIIEETVFSPVSETSEISEVPEAETETEAESESETGTESVSETEAESETEADSEPETESETETETEAETEPSGKNKLSSNTVKWLAYYDPWTETGYPYHQAALQLFEEKYDGEIDIRYTTWNYRFSDLATMIIGGEGVDLFPGMEPVSKYTDDPIFVSYDEYVDWSSPVWSSVKALNDPYAIDGKHHLMVCRPWRSEDADDTGAVPFPTTDNIDEYSNNTKLECYDLCRRANNPAGAVQLIECLIASYNDESIAAKSEN